MTDQNVLKVVFSWSGQSVPSIPVGFMWYQKLLNTFSKNLNELLKVFFPMESFLKCPNIILDAKSYPQTNFQVVSKIAKEVQHFPLRKRLLKKFGPIKTFLKCYFRDQGNQSLRFQLVLAGIKNCWTTSVFFHFHMVILKNWPLLSF